MQNNAVVFIHHCIILHFVFTVVNTILFTLKKWSGWNLTIRTGGYGPTVRKGGRVSSLHVCQDLSCCIISLSCNLSCTYGCSKTNPDIGRTPYSCSKTNPNIGQAPTSFLLKIQLALTLIVFVKVYSSFTPLHALLIIYIPDIRTRTQCQ